MSSCQRRKGGVYPTWREGRAPSPTSLQVPRPHPFSSHHFRGSQPDFQLLALVCLCFKALCGHSSPLCPCSGDARAGNLTPPRRSHQPVMIDRWVSLLGESKVHIRRWSQSVTVWLSPGGPSGDLSDDTLYIGFFPFPVSLSSPCSRVLGSPPDKSLDLNPCFRVYFWRYPHKHTSLNL